MVVEGDDKDKQEPEVRHQFLQWNMVQSNKLLDSHVYLDGCSTVMAFKSRKYLENLRRLKWGIKINCNSGAMRTNQMGEYGSLKVWYIPEGIANIFSMNKLEKRYCITYKSWQGYYVVHRKNGEVWFYKDKNGLPYIDLKESLEDTAAMLVQTGSEEAATAFVQMVHQNYEGFTKCEVLQAKEAQQAMGMLGNPSTGYFKQMVRGNMINNCPVTSNTITNACTIFGPDLARLKGKTVRRMPALVAADYVAIPKEVVKQNKIITLAADVFFVNRIAFLLTVSRQIKFITTENVITRTAKSLSKHLQQVVQVCLRAGFTVHTILMDGEFEKVKEELPILICNTTAAKEHVREAKHSIQTIKERTRGVVCTRPFICIPRRLKIKFI